jgi:hypothetical protein
MGRPRKKLFCPWRDLSWQEHQEARDFVKLHPDGASLDQIGSAMGFSGERARQIYEEAIAKARDHFEVHPDEVHEYRERPPSLGELDEPDALEDLEADEFGGDEERESRAA